MRFFFQSDQKCRWMKWRQPASPPYTQLESSLWDASGHREDATEKLVLTFSALLRSTNENAFFCGIYDVPRVSIWMPHDYGLDAIFLSAGNWYIFCVCLAYCKWNIDEFVFVYRYVSSQFLLSVQFISVSFIGKPPFLGYKITWYFG